MNTELKERICIVFTQVRNDGCRLTNDPSKDYFGLVDKKNNFLQFFTEEEIVSYLRSNILWTKAAIDDSTHHIETRRQRLRRAEILLSELETK